jgi:hypothetical protein
VSTRRGRPRRGTRECDAPCSLAGRTVGRCVRRILASSRRTQYPLTAIKRAEDLLTGEWMAVEVVASALLEHGWLNGYEVKRLVEGTHTTP